MQRICVCTQGGVWSARRGKETTCVRASVMTTTRRAPRLVSLLMMYLDRVLPRAPYHCTTKGAIQMASPAVTGYHLSARR